MKVMSVFGTRPEAIKMCPLVRVLESHPDIESIVCLTGQHQEMLRQVIDIFQIQVHYSLEIMRPGQTLTSITSAVLENFQAPILESKPDIILVHGDTTTAFAAALAGFYHKIPVGHVEAGLRTYNIYSPFPEEINRQLIGRLSTLHFSPTEGNRAALLKENIAPEQIFVTGNTVIDAFATTLKDDYVFHNPQLAQLSFEGKRTVLITAHRRENLGQPLENIFQAIHALHDTYPDLQFVYPVHLNPQVREPAARALGALERVLLIDPVDVEDLHNLMARSYLVMTDSGGLQEEAPYLGVPVLVLRTETERPEAVEAGTVKVVGVETQDIIEAATELIVDPKAHEKMARATNPYGDGLASKRIAEQLILWQSAK